MKAPGILERLKTRARFQAWWPLKSLLRPSPSYYVSHAQFGEDMVLRAILGDGPPGFYVDIGAFHPVFYSNTYHFYRRGWRGLNVDARPGMAEAFRVLRPRDICVEACVAAEPGEVTFYEFEEPAWNTVDPKAAARARAQGVRQVGERRMQAVTLTELLDRHVPAGQEIGFLSIDVEGLDEAILLSHDWRRHRPRAVVFERHDVSMRDVGDLPVVRRLKDEGYEPVARCGPSIIVAR